MSKAPLRSLILLGGLLFIAFLVATGPCEASSRVPSVSWAPDGTIPTEALQDLLDRVVARGIPGAVMGIATPEGAWFTASGVADTDTGEPMSPRHAMRLAGAAETFTAALIWSLIENGPLKLDQKVNRWLTPGLVPKGGAITIGMLLNHTSGLRDHTESAQFVKKMRRDPRYQWSADDVLAITRAQSLKFTPGTQYAYSSTNEYILGLIAEAATGRTVQALLRERFFSPNGMGRTAVRPAGGLPTLNTPGYVWLDNNDSAVSVGSWNFSGHWTAGAGTSTAPDMLTWASGLVGGKILKPETLQRVLNVQSPSMMGYGFEVTRNALGYQRIGRIGHKPGATTDFLIYPDKGWALFIGFNISDSRTAPTLLTHRIIRELRDAAEVLLGWNTGNTYTETIATGRAAMQALLDDTSLNIPSGSVALVEGDRVIWSETFGYIDKASKIQPKAETMFCIGSVSKIIGASAVMSLVDRGSIDLDMPLAHYLPEFRMLSPQYSQITVRMLLNHSAGFGGGEFRNMFSYVPLAGYAEGLEQALAEQRLKHAPGYLSVYCNDCVTMIEPLVASVSGGKSYAEYVQENILKPLVMKNSHFTLTPFAAGTYAPGYIGENPDSQEFAQPHASGGLYTTPENMLHFAVMLMNGGMYEGNRILSEQSVAEMGSDQMRSVAFNPVPTEAYGLGWDNVAHSGLAAVGVRGWHKKGGTMVYETDFVVAPEEGLAVMVTFSGRSLLAGRPAEQIMLHALAERGSIPNVPVPLPDTKKTAKAATSADLTAIVGTYANKGGPIRVKLEPGKPRTLQISTAYDFSGKAWGGTVTGYKLRTDGSFSTDTAPNVSYRALVADGRRYLVKSEPKWSGHYLEESPYGQQVQAAAPISAAWQSRVGKTWLAVNEDANEYLLANGIRPRFRLDALDGLPGYLFATSMYTTSQIVNPSMSDQVARMFLKIPMEQGRDLNDVVIVERGGEEWVRYGSTLYRPLTSVPVLPAGESTVGIGAEGYSEWRQAPVAGTAAITGATAWKLYDPDLNLISSGTGGTADVGTPGSYLMLFGSPDATINLTVTAS
ncbi:MAG: serine hydrolase domain-containing protein [Syntrophobacter sp.]